MNDKTKQAAKRLIEALADAGYECDSEYQGEELKPILKGDEIHRAMVVFEKSFANGQKPPRIRRVWKRLLNETRQFNPNAFVTGDLLMELFVDFCGYDFRPLNDGPRRSGGLKWQGKPHTSIQNRVDRLLKFLWDKQVIDIDVVIDNVWGHDDEVPVRALPNALSKLNQFLEDAEVPWRYAVHGGEINRKENLPVSSPRA